MCEIVLLIRVNFDMFALLTNFMLWHYTTIIPGNRYIDIGYFHRGFDETETERFPIKLTFCTDAI